MFFCDQYVGIILTISVADDSVDEWDCHFYDRGMFNIKFVYRLQRQLAVVQLGQEEGSDP
jgi:hypothetical protein